MKEKASPGTMRKQKVKTSNNCSFGVCMASGDPCSTSADCVQLVCEYYEGYNYGGCVYAKNCGLQEGYHCPN